MNNQFSHKISVFHGIKAPEEVAYLQKYDKMKRYLDDVFQMPDNMVALLMRFLEQNNGELSKRAREEEFSKLTSEEVKDIEKRYKDLFSHNASKSKPLT